MKNSIVLFVFLFMSCFAQAQYFVMDETVEPVDSTRPKVGPNGKSFFNSFIGFQFMVPTEINDRAPVSLGASNGFRIGWMWKHRITNMLSFGYLLDFNTYSYRYEQNAIKDFPDSITHQYQSLSVTTFGTGLYLRINFDVRRGNYIGHYLDAGVYGDWNISRSMRTKDENSLGETVRTRTSGLTYMERYQYGLYGAIGLNKLTFFARYRMSDILKAPYQSAELPRLTVGVGVCLF